MSHSIYSKDFKARLFRWGTAFLRLLPAELAHDLGMFLLERQVFDTFSLPNLSSQLSGLACDVPGIGHLKHPIGLAAGFDKNIRAPSQFVYMGFAFLEGGTITPRPQDGNPKPRLFRLDDQLGLINRMGFNSDGLEKVALRLQKLHWNHLHVPLGINLGKNLTTSLSNALADYSRGLDVMSPYAKYFVINVSSPNTEGLRGLANEDFLRELAAQHPDKLERMWVKLDPDMSRRSLQALVSMLAETGYRGIILSNTHRVETPEKGGMSGHPLAIQATACLEWAYEVVENRIPIIASGGILSGQDVFQRIARGAAAVQIYTALVYRGPLVVASMLQELQAEMHLRGYQNLSELRGSYYTS